MTDSRHLLFVAKPTGYELRERDGDVPPVGSKIELDEGAMYWVSRVGPSPRPGDARQCAYLQSGP